MNFMNEKGAARIVNIYVERELSDYRKVTEKELRAGGITPEAKAAFSRKPYYSVSSMNLKDRPVLQ